MKKIFLRRWYVSEVERRNDKKITKKILNLRPSRLLQYDFTLGAQKSSSLYWEYRYIEYRYIGVLSHRFYCNFCRGLTYLSLYGDIVISRIVVLGFHCRKVIKKEIG